MLAHEDLVVAVRDVVGELGVNLEDHGALVGNGGHGSVVHLLDNEVGVVVADGREVGIVRV